jgi:trimeric autotransporter adhesin
MNGKQLKYIVYAPVAAVLLALTLFAGACSPARTTLTGIVPRTTATTGTSTTAAVRLVSIAIQQVSPVKILMGGTVQFSAMGTYSDGSTADCTGQVIWNSSDSAIASISYSGLATAVTLGNTDITAAINGTISNVVVLEIDPVAAATLTSIAVSRTVVANLPVGKTEQFSALGSYSDGTTQDITSQVNWTSTYVDVATISAAGLATGLKPGQTDISATLAGVTSNDITVTVIAP